MDRLVREDIARYRKAIASAGGVFGGSEPIQQLVKQFEGPLDAAHAAAEVGLEADDFLQKIRENSTLQNAGLLVLGVEKGSVKRDAWESEFGTVTFALNLLKHGSAEAYYGRGKAKFLQGQYEAAITDIDAVLQIKPDFAYAYHARGSSNFKLGQFESAISDFDSALRIKPDFAKTYVARALVKMLLGQYENAITDCNSALQINPDFEDAYKARGFIRYNLGKYESAISDYNSGLQINPNSVEIYHLRGKAKKVLGETSDAKQDFQTALRLAEQSGDQNLKETIEQYIQELEDEKSSNQ